MSDYLTRKIGPLPAWGWALVLVGGVLVYRWFTGGGSPSTGSSVASADTTSPGIGSPDTSSGVAAGGGGLDAPAPSQPIDTSLGGIGTPVIFDPATGTYHPIQDGSFDSSLFDTSANDITTPAAADIRAPAPAEISAGPLRTRVQQLAIPKDPFKQTVTTPGHPAKTTGNKATDGGRTKNASSSVLPQTKSRPAPPVVTHPVATTRHVTPTAVVKPRGLPQTRADAFTRSIGGAKITTPSVVTKPGTGTPRITDTSTRVASHPAATPPATTTAKPPVSKAGAPLRSRGK